jgi:hypothetical protein
MLSVDEKGHQLEKHSSFEDGISSVTIGGNRSEIHPLFMHQISPEQQTQQDIPVVPQLPTKEEPPARMIVDEFKLETHAKALLVIIDPILAIPSNYQYMPDTDLLKGRQISVKKEK